ncbi:glycosyl transferase [Clostridium polyendosporum]|uniref:Glycosyl transferase n=1 Tax=Clostridium polyendosporum TaxID=69208 RepID=A0A919VFF3_9CLOT|nr:glycosyltransferase family 1 protein [Clostridium polyendosporum]GIM30239.1 glycosyl transferase [Clostridium polyendosporum]
MKDKVHVIIDARMVDEHLHGIARYTYELIKKGAASGKVKYTLLVNDVRKAKVIFNKVDNLEFIKMNSKFLSLKEQIELPRILNKYKGKAIFHSPSFVSSPFIKIDTVMTIHDLNHIRYPQFYTPFHKYYYKYIVKPSALNSKKVLTVSNFAKSELLGWLKCEDSRVVVTYNGIDSDFKHISDETTLKKVKYKYDLPDKFILYIGNLKPHKNVETLVKAMKTVKDKNYFLVMNGKLNDKLREVIKEYDVNDRIKFIGFVDDEDLPVLYSEAKVFVFPSLYEGFGLPPLEAMACGCQVIVSDTSSLPEVVGNYGLKFDAKDHINLSNKINQCIESPLLYNEKELKDWMNRYDWQNTFDLTYEIYKEI